MRPVEDRDLLRVTMEQNIVEDSYRLRLYSRHFDWHGGVQFTATAAAMQGLREAAPVIQMCLAAFQPLFRAYCEMPFSQTILRQLLSVTMDRLLPEFYNQIAREGPLRRQYRHGNEIIIRNTRVRNANEFREALEVQSADYAANQLPARAANQMLPAHVHALDEVWRAATRGLELAIQHADERTFLATPPPPCVIFSNEVVERSRQLLLHCLSPVQRAEFEREGWFTVAAQNGQLYKVLQSEVYNVESNEALYCAMPAEACPVFDKMLASKLWLEANIQEFLATANRRSKHRLAGGMYSLDFIAELARARPGTILRIRNGA